MHDYDAILDADYGGNFASVTYTACAALMDDSVVYDAARAFLPHSVRNPHIRLFIIREIGCIGIRSFANKLSTTAMGRRDVFSDALPHLCANLVLALLDYDTLASISIVARNYKCTLVPHTKYAAKWLAGHLADVFTRNLSSLCMPSKNVFHDVKCMGNLNTIKDGVIVLRALLGYETGKRLADVTYLLFKETLSDYVLVQNVLFGFGKESSMSCDVFVARGGQHCSFGRSCKDADMGIILTTSCRSRQLVAEYAFCAAHRKQLADKYAWSLEHSDDILFVS